MLVPRDYQQAAHDAAWHHMTTSLSSFLIEAATGAGKSLIVAMLAKTIRERTGKSVLCLAPSGELVEQNHEKYELLGERASIMCAALGSKSIANPVVFGTPTTIKNRIRRFGSEFALVLVDECFPAETNIKTPKGEVKISDIKKNDVVLCANGRGIVRSVFSKKSTTILIRTKNGKTIRCTPCHPIFTEKGFVKAEKLENGARVFGVEEVQKLLKIISSKDDDDKKREDCSQHIGVTLEQARMLFSILCEEMEEPYAQSCKQGKDEKKPKKSRLCAIDKRRERRLTFARTALSLVRARGRLGFRAAHKNTRRSSKWRLSELLQGRHREQVFKDSNRSRWQKPLLNRKEKAGQEKRFKTKRIGLDSVASIERGCFETVYNLRVSNHPSYFADGILVHNCHGITPTVRHIIDTLKEVNPRIRVGGLTATPYRLGTGYIYELNEADKGFDESQAIDPYFKKRVYAIQAPYLIKKGYLTPPVIGAINSSGYDTTNMQLNSRGQFDKADVDRAYHGHGRKTSAIVGDVVAQSQNRQGVLIFAATIQHAQEVMASLPPSLSAMVDGSTKKEERKRLLREFKARRIKYLVNVAVLTTGFDAPHVDVVALLRATESVGLLQQIIGRGLRLSDNKSDCLILDYAGNVERHCPDGDLFAPIVQATKKAKGKGFINAVCEACGDDNTFPARPNQDGHEIDKHGYFVDLDGNRIEGDIPAHFGRRCTSHHKAGAHFERCQGRWNAKKCPTCDAENDIAARYCSECKGEIVDPNDKLKADFKALKRDPSRVQTDEVLDFSYRKSISKRGNEVLRVDYVTPYRRFSIWHHPESKSSRHIREHHLFMSVKDDLKTITYCKGHDGFYRALGYNRAKDEIPNMA